MPQFMPNYRQRPLLWQFLLPISLLFILFCTPFAIPSAAANKHSQNLPTPVKQALQQAQIPDHAVATWVQEIGSKRPWVAANAQQAMQPASIIKLLTTYAALDILGPAERWKTQAYISQAIENGVLHGDLILQGGGDPKLVYESFWQFLRQLRQQGLRDIQGNLIIDRSLFQLPPHDAAAFDGDPAKPYNVGPDALLLNFKSLRLRFEPNLTTQQVQVQIEPPLAGLNIIAPSLALDANNTTCADWQERLTLEWRAQALYIHGNYPQACGVLNWSIHPSGLSQNDYAIGLFQALWQELGGSFKGQIQDGKRPPEAILFAQWESPSLTEIIRDINKFSNNVMARQLLLTLGAKSPNTANQNVGNSLNNTQEQGRQAVQQWLLAKQLNSPELLLENGAGLSRQEQISAQSMGRILLHAYASPWMPEFVSSLPVVGYDGTMRRRLQQTPMAGQAHIKTGSLHEVRTIAGYVRAASGKIYAVTSMINHANASKGQTAHDVLLQWIYENG